MPLDPLPGGSGGLVRRAGVPFRRPHGRPTFVGLDQWSRAAGNDELRKSVVNTFYMVLIAVSVAFVFSMVIALLLNTYWRGSTVFKLALYFPLLAPPVIAGLIWQYMVHYDFGVANLVADGLGVDKINFLGNAKLALLTVCALEIWRGFGFWVLYWLAGVQGVPGELLDAARVDGASGMRRFFRVTLPVLRPLLLFAVVIAIIYNFQIFDSVYSLTDGGPPSRRRRSSSSSIATCSSSRTRGCVCDEHRPALPDLLPDLGLVPAPRVRAAEHDMTDVTVDQVGDFEAAAQRPPPGGGAGPCLPTSCSGCSCSEPSLRSCT